MRSAQKGFLGSAPVELESLIEVALLHHLCGPSVLGPKSLAIGHKNIDRTVKSRARSL